MINDSLISVIMSTYNETTSDLSKSINSILQQTYYNFEFIIVCDNPDNKEIVNYLRKIKDIRVRIFINDKNMGLVWSLNRALKLSTGNYIARMDADDICHKTRLNDQMQYLIRKNCDLIGSRIQYIDENDAVIKNNVYVPIENDEIKRKMRWGSVLAHPTWFGKKIVFERLNGYRNIPYCEDYDFLIRAIDLGFVLGNLNQVELNYRIRNKGISKSNEDKQYVIHEYLARDYMAGNVTSEKALWDYISSSSFEKDIKKRSKYKSIKKSFIKEKGVSKIFLLFKIMCYNFFWRGLFLKLFSNYK